MGTGDSVSHHLRGRSPDLTVVAQGMMMLKYALRVSVEQKNYCVPKETGVVRLPYVERRHRRMRG